MKQKQNKNKVFHEFLTRSWPHTMPLLIWWYLEGCPQAMMSVQIRKPEQWLNIWREMDFKAKAQGNTVNLR